MDPNRDSNVGYFLAQQRAADKAKEERERLQQVQASIANLNLNPQTQHGSHDSSNSNNNSNNNSQHYNDYLAIWNMTGGPQTAQQAQQQTREYIQALEGNRNDEMDVVGVEGNPVNRIVFGGCTQ